MRSFTSPDGATWVASVREDPGSDYKGRYYLVVVPESGSSAEGFALADVRWNTERTAQRTLDTMSEVELRRRLRSAVGRAGVLAAR
ncbi:MAG: hypothetical protein OEZ37_12375 [Gemmatimonadota bacterium]|nr:hypothetical protein [Gemmatimonadota bacterium]